MKEILSIKSVTKKFGGLVAVNNVDLTIFEGQIMDIVPRAEATPEKLGLLMAGVKEEGAPA